MTTRLSRSLIVVVPAVVAAVVVVLRRTLAFGVCLLAASPAVAQSTAARPSAAPRPMTIVDLINVPRVSGPQLSPDGRHVLFLRSDADWKANKRVSHVWRVPIEGGASTQMTNGAEGESSPRWSPDGKTIAFAGKRQGDEVAQVYLLPAAGGEAIRLTAHETAVSSLAWSGDGRALYFLAADPKSAQEKARDKVKDDVFAYDEDGKQQHLWSVTVAAKAETRLTSGGYSVLSFRLSRDGTRLVLQRGPNTLFGDAEKSEIWVANADGSALVQITKNGVTESGASLSPDNRQVLFVADANAQFTSYYNGKIFVAPASGGGATLIADLPQDVSSAAWSKDGRAVYFVGHEGVRNQLFVLPLPGGGAGAPAGAAAGAGAGAGAAGAGGAAGAAAGAPRALTSGDHSLGGWDYAAAAERHLFTKDEATNPGDVWTIAGSAAPVRVTAMYDGLAREFRIPKQERLEWKGADGVTVEGLLTYPLDYEAGRKYPLIVQTHGGPAAADQFGFGAWGSYVQVLAAKGYAVLKPNYRGSTGYGDPFLRDMVGHYFKNAHLDVMAGVDKLIAMGVADPDRLGKMGWSAGGHMTNKIITFTDRFKAASSGAGASNWVSMYGQSDVRTYRTPWFGGTPWQQGAPIDVYWEHSPLKYAANVKTPTIFLVGERDVRVPLPQSVEMYRALKSHDVPTHLYVAPREPHGFQELRHQLFKVNVELEWFERWITKRPYTWEQAPADPSPDPSPKPAPTAAGVASRDQASASVLLVENLQVSHLQRTWASSG